MEEKWVPVPDYEDSYEISDQGRLRTLDKRVNTGIKNHETVFRKGKIIKPIIQRSGYAHVGLWRNGKCKQNRLHRLVAAAFCKNDDPERKTQVNHINEDKLDNRACNLEWTDAKENTNHNKLPDRRAKTLSKNMREVTGVLCILDGEVLEKFNSIADANEWLGRDRLHRNVSECCRGRYNTTGGYNWWFDYD